MERLAGLQRWVGGGTFGGKGESYKVMGTAWTTRPGARLWLAAGQVVLCALPGRAQTAGGQGGSLPAGTPVQRFATPVATPAAVTATSFPAVGSATTTPAALTPAQRPPHRAEVVFAHGELSVSAENASLNQILREIGRQTGITITGGVAEERVFGKYGPAPVSDLLDALLDGTGSNMLLIPADATSKGQLTLTPRHGGPTPPNPNAPGFDDDVPPDNEGVERFRQPNQGISLYGATPTQTAPVGSGPVTAPGTDQSNPATAVDPQSPNGIKTPQEIFQQLQQLRQQQQQQQTPPQ